MEVPRSHEQYREIVDLLAANDISVHVKTNYFSANLLWVEDHDFQKAKEIAQAVLARYSTESKKRSTQEWKELYRESYIAWLRDRLRHPGSQFKLLLLLVTAGIFLYYPLFYIIRALLSG